MDRENAGNGRSPRREVAHEDEVLAAVRDAIRQIEYGSVLIKIHQGGVVGIETSKKLRLKDRTPGL
ncbi:MAG TPA: DUF2292 domain-containing protein [Actinomycetota bacterium]|nr:DUF2292 domain-containing protein [Actinomycetota bacterium]